VRNDATDRTSFVQLDGIALHGKPMLELQSVTCHMGSHSVTRHPTQVNAPRHTRAI